MTESTSEGVECPICGEGFDPTAAGGWCTNPECGEWQYLGDEVPEPAAEPDDVDDAVDPATAEEPADGDDESASAATAEPEQDDDELMLEFGNAPGDAEADADAATGDGVANEEPADPDAPGDADRAESAGMEDAAEAESAGMGDADEAESAGDEDADGTESAGTTCPECGADAEADAAFCPSCGTDLTADEPLDACPGCGADVDPADTFCASCGEDLEAARSGEGRAGSGPDRLALRARDEEVLVAPDQTVGREIRRIVTETGGDEDEAVRIHREHVRFVREDGRFYVVDLGDNPTELNGTRLAKGDREPVEPGDELALSDVVTLSIERP